MSRQCGGFHQPKASARINRSALADASGWSAPAHDREVRADGGRRRAHSHPSGVMTPSSHKKLSLLSLIALVVGSMIGSGIFALPSAFGRATGSLGAMIAWVVAGGGMLMLAFVFQTLSVRKPELDSGVYIYAKAGFGDYLGFTAAFGYWMGCCFADAACLILIKSTLGLFFPIFGDGTTPVAIAAATALLWGVHFLVLRGVRQAAFVNTVATVAKIVPLVVFLVIAA